MKTFQFTSKWLSNEDGTVEVGAYRDGSIALRLRAINGEPLSMPTVNLEDYGEKPQPGCVFVRDYSETEGLYDSLYTNGIVGEKIRTVNFGHGKAYECRFTLPREHYTLL